MFNVKLLRLKEACILCQILLRGGGFRIEVCVLEPERVNSYLTPLRLDAESHVKLWLQ
jgi:hypothetical protein